MRISDWSSDVCSSDLFLLDRRGFYGFLYLGFGLHVIAVFAMPAWAPTWLVRQYGLPLSEVGVRFGIVSLVSGSLGMWCGPFIGRMLARRGYDDATMRGVVCVKIGRAHV